MNNPIHTCHILPLLSTTCVIRPHRNGNAATRRRHRGRLFSVLTAHDHVVTTSQRQRQRSHIDILPLPQRNCKKPLPHYVAATWCGCGTCELTLKDRRMGSSFLPMYTVYEMFLYGYQFQVLSPVFTIHWGLQERRARPLWREKQNEKNRKQFETFKRELFARYRKDPLHLLRRPPQQPGKKGA
ncbi:unnamed protein product [Plutella xylostella]|uniref:Beta-1,4-glucuronyltransferase 1 n=1 Tax=Plutella xylostella TaxID=51655 RepID=A0A8S4G2I7_PLUXY|nr:unnamed protein product [Plutella xylostella]